jgi:hypothetical protein
MELATVRRRDIASLGLPVAMLGGEQFVVRKRDLVRQ